MVVITKAKRLKLIEAQRNYLKAHGDMTEADLLRVLRSRLKPGELIYMAANGTLNRFESYTILEMKKVYKANRVRVMLLDKDNKRYTIRANYLFLIKLVVSRDFFGNQTI
jgi:hypothetical protein